MMILKWGFLFFLVIIIPFLLGIVPTKYMNKFQRTPAMVYISGWFVSFAVFEVVAIPFILAKSKFTYLEIVYSIVLLGIVFYSIFNIKTVIQKLKHPSKMPIWTYILWVAFIIIVIGQMYIAFAYENRDGDDAYYIAASVMTDTFDDMYVRDNYTGYEAGFDIRHALAPTPLYITWLSRLSGIHPTIIAHTVLSVVWLLLMYLIYGQIANRLLVKKRRYKPLFLLFISVWYMFGNVSMYTSETFAMNRTWQGKGLMAAVIIPALLLCVLYLTDNNVSKGIWIFLINVVIASLFATTVSAMLVPTVLGLTALLVGIQQRNIKRFIQIAACSFPCFLIGIIYALAK